MLRPGECWYISADEKQYLVTCSYVEVYNDGVNDLLVKEKDGGEYLALRDSGGGQPRPRGVGLNGPTGAGLNSNRGVELSLKGA